MHGSHGWFFSVVRALSPDYCLLTDCGTLFKPVSNKCMLKLIDGRVLSAIRRLIGHGFQWFWLVTFEKVWCAECMAELLGEAGQGHGGLERSGGSDGAATDQGLPPVSRQPLALVDVHSTTARLRGRWHVSHSHYIGRQPDREGGVGPREAIIRGRVRARGRACAGECRISVLFTAL